MVASVSGAGGWLCPSALDEEAAPFGAASTASSMASAPPCRFRARFTQPAVAIGRAYSSMSSSLLVRTWCRISSTDDLGTPSLCSPASEFRSFFLRIFRGSSSGSSSSHCWSLLNWRRLSVFQPAFEGGHYTLWRLRSSASAGRSRPGMGGRLSSPPSGEAGGGTSCTLDAWCIGQNFFPVNPGSSRLSLVWWIRRDCASLLLPNPLGACRRPLRLFTG